MWTALGIGGAQLVGGLLGSSASKKAAQAQADAANRQVAEQARQYTQTRADNAPFMGTGVAANRRLAQLLGLDVPDTDGAIIYNGQEFANADALRDSMRQQHLKVFGTLSSPEHDANIERAVSQARPANMIRADSSPDGGSLTRRFAASDLDADPVYQSGLQFGLDEGRAGINARAIAGGGYDSGATLKALTRFGNDYGSTKANESYNRYTNDQNNIYNRLAGVSGAGQVATGQVGAAGANATNATTQALGDAGNARAAGVVGGANAWGNALSGVSGAAQGYQNSQVLDKLLNSRRYGTPPINGGYGLWD